MLTVAVLPVKRFSLAKQRLGAGVGEQLRAALAQAMVADVLQTLAGCSEIHSTVVVCNEPAVHALALSHRAVILADASEQGQSQAALQGLEWALREGFHRAVCVPGDCPALDADELAGLLGSQPSDPREVVIVPDRHGTGTNGLVLSPPDVIAPQFGEGSFARHLASAEDAGVSVRVERPSSLLLDIDTGEDLDVLRERLSARHSGASRTRVVLGLRDNGCERSAPAA